MAIKVFHRDRPDLMLPMISSDARLIVWPRHGAWTAPMNHVRLEPGEENVPHAHANEEDAIYILEGRGSIDDKAMAAIFVAAEYLKLVKRLTAICVAARKRMKLRRLMKNAGIFHTSTRTGKRATYARKAQESFRIHTISAAVRAR